MKVIMTFIGILCASLSIAQRTPADTQEAFEKDPLIIRDTRGSNAASEALAVITAIRAGVSTERAGVRDFTEADYKTLTVNADNFMLQRKYEDAILLYNEILTNRSDQYAKDRIIEARALNAKQKNEEEQQRKDQILRAKAEFASSANYEKHIVHFTGALLSDEFSSAIGTTKIFDRKDPYSNFLRPGKYDVLSHYLQKSGYHTLDGIAIPANTRLIVYKNQHCSGEVLLDITGPAIVNNVIWSEIEAYKEVNTKEFNEQLQPYFPQATRSWSPGNMHEWTKGSMEIRVEVSE
jgi:hypothetical protein